jgi:hypothetical protein
MVEICPKMRAFSCRVINILIKFNPNYNASANINRTPQHQISYKILLTGALCEQMDEAIVTGTTLGRGMCLKIVMLNFTHENQSKK